MFKFLILLLFTTICLDSSQNISNKLRDKEWLNKKTPVRYVYDPDWAPFEWQNELNQHTGIIADILHLISTKSGIKFIPINVNSWNEALKKAKNREADMYSAVNLNKEKQKYMNFTTQSIYKSPIIFLKRIDDKRDYSKTFKNIKNIKIAAIKSYSIFSEVKRDYPKLPLIGVKSLKDGFTQLKTKKIDIFLVNAATAKYYITSKGFDKFTIASKTKYNLDLRIAIRNDWSKDAIKIIDKTIDTISKQELNKIYHKWTDVTQKNSIDWVLISKISIGIIVIILFILWNNYKLKSKVKEKTADIIKQKEALELLSKNLEVKVDEKTRVLDEERHFISSIIKSKR